MIKTLMYHKVADFDKWKSAFENFSDVRKKAGEVSFSIGTLQNEPNKAYALTSWNSIEEFQSFVGSPELSKAMKASGVLEPPTTIILDETTSG